MNIEKGVLMKILVTGAAGTIGRAVVSDLSGRGHDVVALDLAAEVEALDGVAKTVRADVTSIDDVGRAVAGCTGVVHLAGYVEPMVATPEEVFTSNATGAFVVLQALADAGGDRAVLASSASALGMAWSPTRFSPRYVPIDEEHPPLPADPYGLSKLVLEQVGAMFARRHGMTVAALRFPWAPGDDVRWARIAEVAADPEHEGALRDLWSYVHPRDVALAAALALEAEPFGFEVFNVTAGDTISDLPTAELLRRFHPATEVREEIDGTAAAWSTRKAAGLLGFAPTYSWRPER